ncbi:hypothetical protein DL96DRAFT_1610244 [Flagelloscypha sp. PMI_526]|nr:hypothetical protein DL96DRAFT_1610244 [Flagelloscypha sp. PMI_526]
MDPTFQMLAAISSLNTHKLLSRKEIPVRVHGFRFNDSEETLLQLYLTEAQLSESRSCFLTDIQLDKMHGKISEYIRNAESDLRRLRAVIDQVSANHAHLIALQELVHDLRILPNKTFVQLPNDILWNIFMISAQDGGPAQRRILSLVSNQVQQWIDPILFSSLLEAALLQDDIPPSPRLSRVFRNAMCLSGISGLVSSEELSSHLERLPSVRTFTFQGQIDLIWSQIEFPSITRLESEIGLGTISFVRDMFPNITHISLRLADFVDPPWELLADIRQLHFLAVLPSRFIGVDDEYSLLSTITSIQTFTMRIPYTASLKVILWYNRLYPRVNILEDHAKQLIDQRLVVCLDGDVPAWKNRDWPFLRLKEGGWKPFNMVSDAENVILGRKTGRIEMNE